MKMLIIKTFRLLPRAVIFSGLLVVLLGMGCELLRANPLNGVTIELEQVAKGLNRPVGLTHAGDGSGRIFITLQSGEILVSDGNRMRTFLDISSLIKSTDEMGLLGIAFHPNYAKNGFFYVNYTNVSGATVISRFTRSSNPWCSFCQWRGNRF